MKRKYLLIATLLIAAVVAVAGIAVALQSPPASTGSAPAFSRRVRPHFDHAPVTPAKFETPRT